ncbi:unnamed protein product [Acanthoscelides obtectus]|uniref:Uncharacterized protein n=1 Tax=Acanthoscelides obtectus TaxID=200917 RepID=A0A9P0JJZ1_ACAOB|nr:unnamed protein product [Acanthoscelides obtectus]CAK1639745.1 hypothetical protein AOBTE_LOCUS11351 [Acanthoscelides obtectus]
MTLERVKFWIKMSVDELTLNIFRLKKEHLDCLPLLAVRCIYFREFGLLNATKVLKQEARVCISRVHKFRFKGIFAETVPK